MSNNKVHVFEWAEFGMGTCLFCEETKGGWYLMAKNKGGICSKCVKTIADKYQMK